MDNDKTTTELTFPQFSTQNVNEVLWRANYNDNTFLDQKEELPDKTIKEKFLNEK